MNIGVPKETASENRVGLTPDGAGMLAAQGHQIYVQSKAGAISGFNDDEYRGAGAEIVYSADEAWGRSELVVKVRAPIAGEYQHIGDEHIIAGFLHLAVAPRLLIDVLLQTRSTAIAYETIDAGGHLPVVAPMSEIAGRMIPLVAGELLTNTAGGKGLLLGGLPGVPSPEIVIVGAGVVGYNAAKAFLAVGAQVTLMDTDPDRLRAVDDHLAGRANLMLATAGNLRKVCRFADVLVGAILVPGERSPRLITRAMVRSMKPRSVIMDISIDQGGCVETSHPTTIENPTYIEEDVIHYCVPNMSSAIARTASQVITFAALPFISLIAAEGIEAAVRHNPALARGIVIAGGGVVSRPLAESLALPQSALTTLFKVE